MGEIVSPNQSAFVKGKLIQDNLAIAHEIFHALKKKNWGGKDYATLKLDMSKAYDRVEWDFLKDVLLAYGFHGDWDNLVWGW